MRTLTRSTLVLAVVFWSQSAFADGAGAPVNTGADGSAQNGEWCPSVAVTTLPDTAATGKATRLIGRKNVTVQNNSSATCYVTFDAQNPVTTGALGVKLSPSDMQSFDFGSRIPVKVACTAATTTPSCLQILQAK